MIPTAVVRTEARTREVRPVLLWRKLLSSAARVTGCYSKRDNAPSPCKFSVKRKLLRFWVRNVEFVKEIVQRYDLKYLNSELGGQMLQCTNVAWLMYNIWQLLRLTKSTQSYMKNLMSGDFDKENKKFKKVFWFSESPLCSSISTFTIWGTKSQSWPSSSHVF